jgi:diguanylate cyclase (GGDEF)-like protein
MAVPVKDASGKIRAVLAGITATAATGLFDLLQQSYIGKGGGFLVIDPKEQIFIAATEQEMVMRATAAPGVNPLHDKASKGGKGSGVTVNAKGVEEIAAYAAIPSTGWFAVARIPTAEAFLSVGRAQRYVVRNAVIMISFFILILVVGLSYIFRPLASAADHASRMTNGELPFAPLPVVRDDEVGHLTAAFNKLLEKLLRNREEMRKMANHDPLTALPNRLLLADRMGQAIARADRNGTRLAVLYLDLDGFKPINDQFGHEAGDFALVEIAKRLSSVVREADTVSRIGGDEFVIVIADLDEDVQLAQGAGCAVAEKCIEIVAEPIQIRGEKYCVGVSIGISIGNGKASVESLLSAADSSMYAAKQKGKGRFIVAEQLLPATRHS